MLNSLPITNYQLPIPIKVMNTVVLNLEPVINLSDEQFYQLCTLNRDLSLELNATEELIIVPPVGGESGNQEADLIGAFQHFNYGKI